MTRPLFFVGLLFLGAAFGALYVAYPRVPPALFCEEPVLDLGELHQKEEAIGLFTLTNGTAKTIAILGISENCACGVSHVSTDTIKPGGKSEITVKWKTGARRGRSEVALRSDCVDKDGIGMAVAMLLKGTIVPEYDVEPLEPKFETGVCEKHIVKFSANRMTEVYVKNVCPNP